MPETNALPTEDDLVLVRADLDDKLPEGTTIEDWLGKALVRVKRDIEDKRDVKWLQVYDLTNDQYYDNDDNTERNKDRLQECIMLCTSYLVFEQYAIRMGEDSEWSRVRDYYKTEYETLLLQSRLDIDKDEDGEVEDGEEDNLGQSYMVK